MLSFLKKYFSIVRQSVLQQLQRIFVSQIVPLKIKQTQLVLVPKKIGADTINQYMPISLCNVPYKMITKILVNHMRPLLNDLVHPTQVGFIARMKGLG